MSKRKAASSKRLAFTLLMAGTTGTVAMIPSAVYAATTGTIQGTVRNAAGAPLAGALVTLLPSGQQTRTDSAGNYVFSGLDPTTYTVRVERAGFNRSDSQATVTQDNSTPVNVTLASATISTGKSRITGSAVALGNPTTQYTIGAKVEQQTKSQPNNLYQFPGLVFGQPGITPDPSGYTHIRGSDFNQVGFDVDGIQITEPMTNSFATNLVTVGLKSANLYTGGADASYGNATGGFINEVTQNGRDIQGGHIEGTFGPDHGWNYSGTHDEYGNVIGKFDYYASTIDFHNKFPDNTQLARLGASSDNVLKFNYYADPNDTVTAFYNTGFEQYDDYQTSSSNIKYIESQSNIVQQSSYQQDHDDQGYTLGYVAYKHNFSNSSFLTYRVDKLYSFVTFHEENLASEFENRHSDQIGNQVDYTNQISSLYQLKAGIAYTDSTTQYHLVTGASAPIADVSAYGYNDRTSQVAPKQSTIYLSNQFKTADNKGALTLGIRAANDTFDFKTQSKTSDHYVDPRLGLTYAPVRDLNFRTSYSVQSQFPDTDILEREAPEQVGITPTATDPAAQLARFQSHYAYNPHLSALHANDYDLGVDKGLTLTGPLEGSYLASLTGFKRYQYDLIQLHYGNGFDATSGSPYPISYDSSGTGHASGLEFKFSKLQRRQTDWNGFVSYTNQVARATSSDFDTGYEPYFAFYDYGDSNLSAAQFANLDKQEYATSYDQRHTVGVVVGKRISKLIDFSSFLDAGSGFPFAGGSFSNGEFGSVDSQHSEITSGSADFSEVPVVLQDGKTIQPINPVVGRTGWHYKITLNTNFYITPDTNLFFNVDNIFDRKTAVTYATSTQAGSPYYTGPSAAFPQGTNYYGPSTILTPIFLTFGFRQRF